MPEIHPTAFVHPSAKIADDVIIAPQAYIDADVVIGKGTKILHGAHVARWTTLGENNIVYPGAVIGHDPQDVGYKGEESYTIIGNGNIMREGFTVHRGNREGTTTVIGDNNFFMVNSHIAHNCIIGNNIILVNGAGAAGHVKIDDRVILSSNCLIHQFVHVGAYAMMRGGSGITKDLPPYCINDGMNWVRSINSVGLRRNGFDQKRIMAIKKAFRTIFKSGLSLTNALQKIENEMEISDDVAKMLDFIRSSKRGIASGRRSGGE